MLEIINKRHFDTTWDFATANTKEYSHCYHPYPAMMIPQVARRLIKEFSIKHTKLLFDPYCGTGSSLLEANLKGINTIGTDLNPLARLIAKTKTTKYDIKKVYDSFEIIKKCISEFNHNNHDYDLFNYQNTLSKNDNNNKYSIPKFHNIDFWFSKEVKDKLALLKHIINEKLECSVREFLLVSLSETIRESSYTRNNEFKLFRIPVEKIKSFNLDPFAIFFSKVSRNIKGLNELLQNLPDNVYTKIFDFNTCYEIPENIFKDGGIDIIVTSPPYGDSRTTVAYGQFSRLSNQWLGYEDANKVDNLLMGGNGSFKSGYIEFDSAINELNMIKGIDIKRFNDIQSFLIDYQNSITNITPFVNKGAYVCYVLGNRTVKNIQIPLDLITVEIFSNLGFEHIKTVVRNIPNKRMPKSNSPTNKVGITSSTMNNEYIVVLKKN